MAEAGKGFLGRPKEPGEERERQCDKCKKVTWQTYRVSKGLFSNAHMWRCNLCGRDSYFDF